MTTEPTPKMELTPLHENIQTLINITRDLADEPPSNIALIYQAAVGLLCQLHADRRAIQEFSQKEGNVTTCLSPEAVPGVTAVIHDARLFQALVKCLQVVDAHEFDKTSGIIGGDRHNLPGRKRTNSFSGEPTSSKLLKLTHSPVPIRQKQFVQIPTSSSVSNHTAQHLSSEHDKITFNVPVLAATVLYAAFQHVDHWPAPFVKAYADDCFGPRLWVDDVRCQLFVQNLAMVHAVNSDASIYDDEKQLEDAKLVAEAYSTSFIAHTTESENDWDNVLLESTQAQNSNQRRYSLSSADSASMKQRSSADSASMKQHQHTLSVDSKALSENPQDEQSASRSNGELKPQGQVGNNLSSGPFGNGIIDDGDSSSSGEEDEVLDKKVISTAGDAANNSNNSIKSIKERSNDFASNEFCMPASHVKNGFELNFYPLVINMRNMASVRQRFFCANLEQAQSFIIISLRDRLDLRSKQNSGLLQTLPAFLTVPSVRLLVAEHLGKWLQSPALAGLARTLFSFTVNNLKIVHPPLESDLEIVDCILSMRLKANQLNAHLDNITAIARRLPDSEIVHHMFSKLLPEALTSSQESNLIDSNYLKMIVAIHRVVPPQVSYDALAASLLMLLSRCDDTEENGGMSYHLKQHRLVRKLRSIICTMSKDLKPVFDGYALMYSLFTHGVTAENWSVEHEESKARLMFQCATLSAALFSDCKEKSCFLTPNRPATAECVDLKNHMMKIRLIFLRWCCVDYGPKCRIKVRPKQSQYNGNFFAAPDFCSTLGTTIEDETIPNWLNTMRCVLFLEEANSPLMRAFISPDSSPVDELVSEEEVGRIQFCCNFGCTVNDEMIWQVIKACSMENGGIEADMAIRLLENLFEGCEKGRHGSLEVADPTIIWELYNLTAISFNSPMTNSATKFHSNENNDDIQRQQENSHSHDESTIPRLATPGLWWRVTMLALVMCGASTETIGAIIWNEHPTLRAMVKMVTSNRYRFPTVDCDEETRGEMKAAEQASRDKEMSIAEILFLPQIKNEQPKTGGSRISKRLLKQQQAKEAAQKAKDLSCRKKLLKKAQKAIMLWDPDGAARKPPREAAVLLISVEKIFGLSEMFQRATNPDFLLLTLGGTSRDSIERAYDWLIPIISRFPDTISRLPSSASCFLLLRAYGAGNEERMQLKELSTPLLSHVSGSLKGVFGEVESIKAFDLLLSEVANHKPDRRRSARKVINDSLSHGSDPTPETRHWTVKILDLKYATSLVSECIKHMSQAATFERGSVLRSFVIALEHHHRFAEVHSINLTNKFPDLVIELISGRPYVFAEAMDSFSELRSLIIRVVHDEFSRFMSLESSTLENNQVEFVEMNVKKTNEKTVLRKILPLSLLKATTVLLGIWKDDSKEHDTSAFAVDELVNYLLQSEIDATTDNIHVSGLASASLPGTDKAIVAVKVWIMLAKARSDVIAKRAALSAPLESLPRLLLCSGLPRASLVTMIERLDSLGDDDLDASKKCYESLLASSLGERDARHTGLRREFIQKLLGRLAAYLRLYQLCSRPTGRFISWLSKECDSVIQKPKKLKSKRFTITNVKNTLTDTKAASSIIAKMENIAELPAKSVFRVSSDAAVKWISTISDPKLAAWPELESIEAQIFLAKSFNDDDIDELQKWMPRIFARSKSLSLELLCALECKATEIAIYLLNSFLNKSLTTERAKLFLLRWIPVFCQSRENDKLWRLLFSRSIDEGETLLEGLTSNCMLIWDMPHIVACLEWIVECAESVSNTDYADERIIAFAYANCNLDFNDEKMDDGFYAHRYNAVFCSKRGVLAWAKIVFHSLDQVTSSKHSTSLNKAIKFILFIACQGKFQTQIVVDAILDRILREEKLEALMSILLRLYLLRPDELNMSKNAEIRIALVEAAKIHRVCWTNWQSAHDDFFSNVLDTVVDGDLKLLKPLVEITRSHPLLTLRRLGDMVTLLKEDATIGYNRSVESRVVVEASNLTAPCEAILSGHLVKVSICYWGFSFTEPLWFSLLDANLSMPKEILYGCALNLGFLDFLSTFLELLNVQLHLPSRDRVGRLKSKLMDVFLSFKQFNLQGWKEWLTSRIDGSEVRHIMMSCNFVTPQEATEILNNHAV